MASIFQRLIQPEPPQSPSVFPDPALMTRLIDEYFHRLNIIYPLLHRPTFEQGLRTGLHLRDEGFGSTVLLVCAIGARFFDDKAVLPEGTTSYHWAGWKWFQQVNLARKFVHVAAPRVYDLQVCALLAWYIGMSPVPHAVYSVVGYGIRLARDLGIHRRATYGPCLTADDELKRRALWCLVVIDRTMCDKLGRPYNVEDEDFDVDFPTECDDEYWFNDKSELVFMQPPDQPSTIIGFNCMLRLTRIYAEGYRAMCYLPASRLRLGLDEDQKIVSEFDSKLNEFIGSIPEHLKWNPQEENCTFMNQAAVIYTCYYNLQIMIHRSFLPSPEQPSSVPSTSLAICTNAARCCIHIIDILLTKTADSPYPQAHWHPFPLFTSATVLLLNVWNNKKNGITTESDKDLRDVHKANQILKTFEKRWLGAARLWYILQDVISVITKSPPREKRKRKRMNTSVDDTVRPNSSFNSALMSEPHTQRSRHMASTDPVEQPSLPEDSTTPSSSRSNHADFLPAHHEPSQVPGWSNFDGMVASTSNITTDPWSVPGGNAFMGSRVAAGDDQAPPDSDIDPELEAIFANLFPDLGYGGVFGSFPQSGVGAFDPSWARSGDDAGMDHAQNNAYLTSNLSSFVPTNLGSYSDSSSPLDNFPTMFRPE